VPGVAHIWLSRVVGGVGHSRSRVPAARSGRCIGHRQGRYQWAVGMGQGMGSRFVAACCMGWGGHSLIDA
jgi:hypothetical protein